MFTVQQRGEVWRQVTMVAKFLDNNRAEIKQQLLYGDSNDNGQKKTKNKKQKTKQNETKQKQKTKNR